MESMSAWAKSVMNQKYAHDLGDRKEEWPEIAMRVTKNVLGVFSITEQDPIFREIYQAIVDRKFIPGGRYLYAAGRPFHQVQNCLLLRVEDSREGWADLLHRAAMALMTGAGIGVDYSAVREEGAPIRKTGGQATGPCALMQMLNEAGRGIMQGGARRSAIWAGLNWKHKDIFRFMGLKNWPEEIKAMKAKDFNAYAPMDMTNISVLLDDEFFVAYTEASHPDHDHAQKVYWQVVTQMMMNGEPGFSVDVGENAGETLRNAPVVGSTRVLTDAGYKTVDSLVGKSATLWTGKRWAKNVVFKKTKKNASLVEVRLTNGRTIVCDPEHPFMVRRYLGAGKNKKIEVVRVPAAELCEDDKIASDLPQEVHLGDVEDYGLGYVYGDGSIFVGQGELSAHADDKRTACDKACAPLCKGELLSGRLSARFIAGWFDGSGRYTSGSLCISSPSPTALQCLQESLDQLGIKSVVRGNGESPYVPGKLMYTLSVLSSSLSRFCEIIPTIIVRPNLPAGWKPYRESEIRVASVEALDRREDVYCCDVGYEEHSFMAEGVLISNCTEITSADDDDICNLGSINMARVSSLEEMDRLVDLGTLFLIAGTVYSDIPYAKVGETRAKNRRLGLGLMGIHEWLLQRGLPYKPCRDLEPYLEVYATSTEKAWRWADMYNLSRPVKTRAIAPNGTIGIVAETTTSGEPLFAAAYLRRRLVGKRWESQYVVDPVAKRLVEAGVDPDTIEDAYKIAAHPETRVQFQAWLQGYVDHGISSTVNLPAWGTEHNNSNKVKEFGDMLFRYLPKLRGITAYPDGSRGGQPLTPVDLKIALAGEGQVFIESTDICDITKAGSCGS